MYKQYNALVSCQPKWASIYQTVNMVISFLKIMKIPNPKGRELIQMYRVVPQTKTTKTFHLYVYLSTCT